MIEQIMSGPQALTDKDAARELFVAGYHQALDDVVTALDSGGCPRKVTSILERLRARAGAVKARGAPSSKRLGW